MLGARLIGTGRRRGEGGMAVQVRPAARAVGLRPDRAWWGYAAAALAALRLPVHLYYGLGGGVVLPFAPPSAVAPSVHAMPDALPAGAAAAAWRSAHLLVALVLITVALLAVAVAEQRAQTPVLVVLAPVIAVAALAYGLVGLPAAWAPWSLAPWSAAYGVLLAFAVTGHRLGRRPSM